MKDFEKTEEENTNEIMKKVRKIAEEAIIKNKDLIEYMKAYLVVKQTITGDEMDKLIECYEKGMSIGDATIEARKIREEKEEEK